MQFFLPNEDTIVEYWGLGDHIKNEDYSNNPKLALPVEMRKQILETTGKRVEYFSFLDMIRAKDNRQEVLNEIKERVGSRGEA